MDGDQNNRGIYGQKISATGERTWTDNGKSIIEISSTNVYPFSASQSQEDMIVFYEEYINAVDGKIKAMRLDTEGEFVWENEKIDLCSVPSGKIHAEAGNLYFNQWIAVWEDDRNGAKDIYGQNIQLDGILGPVVIQGEIEVYPDTLFFEESPQVLPCKILNNTSETYTITELDENGWLFWYILDPVPAVPYDLLAGDSLIFEVELNITIMSQFDGYEFEYLHIISELDTHTVVIAVNEDLLINISKNEAAPNFVNLFPNPSNSSVKFEFTAQKVNNGVLYITDQTGKLIRRFKLDGKSSLTWDGKNENNRRVKPGPYFYQLVSDEVMETGKIIMLE
jgi:hypothetical protein